MRKKVRLVKNNLKSEIEILFEHKNLSGSISTHWHNFYEIDIIISGNGRTFINGHEYAFKEGTVIFMTPSDFHDFSPETEMALFNIQFSGINVDTEILNSIINQHSRIVYMDSFSFESLKHYLQLFKLAKMNNTYLNKYYLRILENILLLFQSCITDSNSNLYSVKPILIQEIIIYVHAHFTENPLLKDVAEIFHMNENYLSTQFKEYTGLNYKDYMRNLKLQHIQNLICYTDLPITEIALNNGYHTLSSFNRDFKNMFHIAPRKMREDIDRDYNKK